MKVDRSSFADDYPKMQQAADSACFGNKWVMRVGCTYRTATGAAVLTLA
jgi:hypothetical protein